MLLKQIQSALIGIAIGDALGVPVEFKSREFLKLHPITDMVGFGTHNQPPGTFSDDSSLSFCLAEMLSSGYDLNLLSNYFVNWLYEGFWTANGDRFDVGNTTKIAVNRLKKGSDPLLAGESNEESNGNGALMRILPLLFYLWDQPIEKRFEITKEVCSLTHRHIRSVIASFYYLEFARLLVQNKNHDKHFVYRKTQTLVGKFLFSIKLNPMEIFLFEKLLSHNLEEFPSGKIQSSGYVIHTLEASIWCLMTTDNYEKAVLKAVNLGGDTDTTGAVTGGLAGLFYGIDSIPTNWINQLARYEDILELSNRFASKYKNSTLSL